jgi:hypothetical protein
MTGGVELNILVFCDIRSVLYFSYCNKEHYALVHNSDYSDWIWKHHTTALLGYEPQQPQHSWKNEYIRSLTAFDTSMIISLCKKDNHFEFKDNNKTISRGKSDDQSSNHCWEIIFSNRVMKPNTITYLEYAITQHNAGHTSNVFRIAVGAVSEAFNVQSIDHCNIIGQYDKENEYYGFSFIIGSGQMYINAVYQSVNGRGLTSGDHVGFKFDNGVTEQNKVLLTLYINDKDMGVMNQQIPLPVLTYRPCVALCSEQEVSIVKFNRLQ